MSAMELGIMPWHDMNGVREWRAMRAAQNKEKRKKGECHEERHRINTVVHKLDHGNRTDRAPHDYSLGKAESGCDGLRQGVSLCPHPQAGPFREQEFLQARAFGRSLAR